MIHYALRSSFRPLVRPNAIQDSVCREYTLISHILAIFINSIHRNTAILIRGELDVQSRCPAIVSEVQKCFEDQDGQLLTVGDVVALAATEHCGIMEYVAKILSQAHLALRTERRVHVSKYF